MAFQKEMDVAIKRINLQSLFSPQEFPQMAELFLLRRRVGADRLPGPGVPHGHGGQRGHAHLPMEGVRGAHARADRRDVHRLLPMQIPVRSISTHMKHPHGEG